MTQPSDRVVPVLSRVEVSDAGPLTSDAQSTRAVGRMLSELATSDTAIDELLHAIRTHLGMEIAFVSEFTRGQRVFRHVDADSRTPPLIQVGDADPLEETYCVRVADGRLPRLIPDTAEVDATGEVAATATLPVGAHLSVPLILGDGSLYGTFCCFSRTPDRTLSERDLAMMQVFAELAAHRIESEQLQRRRDEVILGRLAPVLDGQGLSTVFQPIIELESGSPSGFEALARFAPEPVRGPDVWFADAHSVGLEVELDLAALRCALGHSAAVPGGAYLALNVTPSTVTSGRLAELCNVADARSTVLEVTEHDFIQSYAEIVAQLAPLREAGVRLSVDDAGAGYASLRHILSLNPDVIKLDMSLTRGIHADPARRALISAMASFGSDTGAQVVAEGVETIDELETLRAIGVSHAQGYYLGRPGPLPV